MHSWQACYTIGMSGSSIRKNCLDCGIEFDALPNPKGVHNRRGKLQVMMREQRLTNDDLSDPISRVLRDNDIGITHKLMYGIAGSIGIKTGASRFYIAIVVRKSKKCG